jgi:drug/metabolite transporter (DMT)-like permease
LPVILLTSIAVILRILANPTANVFQKQLTLKGYHPLIVNFISYFGLSVLCVVIAFRVSWHLLPPQFWLYSILGGITGALGNAFLVKALQKGDLSVLGPINAYKSVVGIIAGIFLLGEIPNVWGALGTVLIIGGSYLVLDTTEEKFTLALLGKKEIQYRLWALLLTAVEAVFIKKVILASDVGTSFLSWCWFGALFSFLLLPLYHVNLSADRMLLAANTFSKALLLIICIGTMQLTTIYVFDQMPVGYALALFQLSTLVSVLLGYRFFQEKDIRKKLAGAAIMMIGSVLIILLKEA